MQSLTEKMPWKNKRRKFLYGPFRKNATNKFREFMMKSSVFPKDLSYTQQELETTNSTCFSKKVQQLKFFTCSNFFRILFWVTCKRALKIRKVQNLIELLTKKITPNIFSQSVKLDRETAKLSKQIQVRSVLVQ